MPSGNYRRESDVVIIDVHLPNCSPKPVGNRINLNTEASDVNYDALTLRSFDERLYPISLLFSNLLDTIRSYSLSTSDSRYSPDCGSNPCNSCFRDVPYAIIRVDGAMMFSSRSASVSRLCGKPCACRYARRSIICSTLYLPHTFYGDPTIATRFNSKIPLRTANTTCAPRSTVKQGQWG